MKKICFTIDTNTSGGAERVTSVLANYFAGHTYDVFVINSDRDTHFYEMNDSVHVVKMQLDTSEKGRFASLKRFFQKFNFLRKWIQKEKPDVVVTFLFNMEAPTILAGLLTHTKVFTSVRNSVKAFSKEVNFFRRLFYPKIAGVIFQSQNVMNAPMFRHVKNAKVIMNPLSENKMNISPCASRERNNHIISVGRLHSQKNQKMLISAFSMIAEEFCDLELHIYGEGPLRNELQNQIRELALENRVFLEGAVNDAVLLNKDARLFVMSSDYEGFPNALVEAMAVGIPVISTDFDSGVAALLINDSYNGFLCPVGDVNALTEKMRTALNKEIEIDTIVSRAIETVKNLYPEKICAEWEEFLSR